MSDTESFLIVDDLIGLNEKIDQAKLSEIANEYRQTNTYRKKGREYYFSQTFNLKDWEALTSNDKGGNRI